MRVRILRLFDRTPVWIIHDLASTFVRALVGEQPGLFLICTFQFSRKVSARARLPTSSRTSRQALFIGHCSFLIIVNPGIFFCARENIPARYLVVPLITLRVRQTAWLTIISELTRFTYLSWSHNEKLYILFESDSGFFYNSRWLFYNLVFFTSEVLKRQNIWKLLKTEILSESDHVFWVIQALSIGFILKIAKKKT